MTTIGDFARLGQVSMRMLRHYDRLGLLAPAHVDPWTGHRSYALDQLARLHRIVALKDLGFPLAQVAVLLDDELGADELGAMLRQRQAELEREHQLAQERLTGVAARLRLIEKEHHVPQLEFVTKSLPEVRLAALTAAVTPDQTIGEVVEACFDGAQRAVASAGGSLAVAVAHYDSRLDGTHVVAGFGHTGPAPEGTEIVTVRGADQAVCCVHLGPMEGISATWRALLEHVEASGLEPVQGCREDYLRAEGDDQSDWVVELQQPVRRRP